MEPTRIPPLESQGPLGDASRHLPLAAIEQGLSEVALEDPVELLSRSSA